MNNNGHYYNADGSSAHLTMGKNGKERPTTIKDARERRLFPSVTTILGILDKPQLTAWKLNQVAAACWAEREGSPEPLAAYSFRMIEQAFEQVDDAADLGTNIHAALENHFQGRPYNPELKIYVESVDTWVRKNSVEFAAHELRLVNAEHGFAGTTDADILWGASHLKQRGILDFKSRKSKPEYKMAPWDGEPTQIAAYAKTRFGDLSNACGVNVFISTTEPGRVEATWYDAATLQTEWEVFQHLCAIWRQRKNYDPRKQS